MQANGPLLLDLVGHHDHMRAGESAAIINFVSLRCATLVVVMASANTMLRSILPMDVSLLIDRWQPQPLRHRRPSRSRASMSRYHQRPRYRFDRLLAMLVS